MSQPDERLAMIAIVRGCRRISGELQKQDRPEATIAVLQLATSAHASTANRSARSKLRCASWTSRSCKRHGRSRLATTPPLLLQAWTGGGRRSARAMLAASTQGPISSLVLMMELTGQARAFALPMLTAIIVATATSRLIERRSIYEARLTDEQVAARLKAREASGA